MLYCLLPIIMDAYFPIPLPDESLYSLIVRYKTSLPYSSRHMSQNLFGHHGPLNSPNFLGQNAIIFYQRHSEFWRSERAFIRAMTGCNLLYLFLTPSAQSRFYKALQGYTGNVVALLRPHIYFPNNDFSSLKYCPECVTRDIEQHGVAYWHRSHCVWFVAACWQHSCPLTVMNNKSGFELPPQGLSHHGSTYSNVIDVTLANLVHDLLVGKLPWAISLLDLYDCYQYATTLNTARVKSAADKIEEKLSGTCSESTLTALKIRRSFNGTGQRCWIKDVLNTQRPVHIPEHLLVISSLFKDIGGLKATVSKLKK